MRTLQAPTKINIVLRITGRRPDGYHDLWMLNEKLRLCDEVGLSVLEQGQDAGGQIKITCDDPNVPCNEQNICYKAARAILDDPPAGPDAKEPKRLNTSIHIHIKKRIPVAAGLGGGSSNAAATLKGLNELLGLGLSREKLATIGVRLGADVPFFLYDGPAICEGIGDKITPLDRLPNMWILLINPGFPVSTRWVYEEFDKLHELQLTEQNQAVRSLPLKGLAEVAKIVHNDLELVTAKKYPEIERIKKLMKGEGAVASWMSGSGATVVGIFESEEMCHAAAINLQKQDADWRVIETSN